MFSELPLNLRYQKFWSKMPENKTYARSEDCTVRTVTKNESSDALGPTSVTTRHIYLSENFVPARANETIPGSIALAAFSWEAVTSWNRRLFSLADGLKQANHVFLEKFGLKLQVCEKRFASDDRQGAPRISLVATGTDNSAKTDFGGGLFVSALAVKRLDLLAGT